MKFMQTTGYTKCGHKRNEDILDKLIKPVIDCIQNYQREWKEHNEYRKNPRTNFTLSAKRAKINLTSNEEMAGKYETVTAHLA
jgi:hypothetical protein